jgi:SAM-dependent methyltransferase
MVSNFRSAMGWQSQRRGRLSVDHGLSAAGRHPQTAPMAHHHVEIDWVALGTSLEREAELHTPLYDDALRWVRSVVAQNAGDEAAAVRLVIDVGAGPGVISCRLAAINPAARVVAVDGSAELLDRVTRRAVRLGVKDRVETRVIDLPEGLDDLEPGSADLVWASHVMHHLGDQQDALRRVGGLLRPGGVLGIAESGLPTRTLPRDIGIGRPGLETRLDAAKESWFDEMRTAIPDTARTVEHWPGLLAGAGLQPVGSRTFLLDLPAPLDSAAREFVRWRFERARDGLRDQLDGDDVAVLDQLLDEDDPFALARRDDVFLLAATTVHLARAAGTPA